MKIVLFVIACLIAAAIAAPLTQEQKQFLFTKFVQQYNKQYEMNEIFERLNVFSSNLEQIIAHNAKNSDLKLALNQFGDLSNEEFSAMMKLRAPKKVSTKPCGSKADVFTKVRAEVEDVDWRKSGYVTPVKNQGQCGSCWAFSAVSPLETAWGIHSSQLIALSEQQLVDCATEAKGYENAGCNGGLMTSAYDYYIKEGGACSESEYKYTARDGKCKEDCTRVATMSSYQVVNGGDALIAATAKNPVSVALAASGFAFQFYSSGVVKGASCKDKSLDHGVTVVAYTNASGVNPAHYTIRNSWGQSWGESGHIRLEAGVNCLGVESDEYNSIPIV